MCPTMAAHAGAARRQARQAEVGGRASTARSPWRRRASSTATAQPLPSARATLVAPMLPLPTLRRSTPLRARDDDAERDRARAGRRRRARHDAGHDGAAWHRREPPAGWPPRPERGDVSSELGARAVGRQAGEQRRAVGLARDAAVEQRHDAAVGAGADQPAEALLERQRRARQLVVVERIAARPRGCDRCARRSADRRGPRTGCGRSPPATAPRRGRRRPPRSSASPAAPSRRARASPRAAVARALALHQQREAAASARR